MTRSLFAVLLVASLLLAGCTSERDGDGLSAEVEANGWTIEVIYSDGSKKAYHVTSDPTKADTDGDGLNDFQEFQRGSDPRMIDTDGDRLLDGPMICNPEGDLRQRILAAEIIEHPERPGCYLGESRWEYQGHTIVTDPANANTDSNPTIGDGLPDGEEILGWYVTVGPETYHVWSSPRQDSADTDNDGLHDGAEKRLGLDPRKADTDGDGIDDPLDAAPLGNLVITFTLEEINLKRDYRITGGARLVVDIHLAGLERSIGPIPISEGENRLNQRLQLDVDDTATGFDEDGAGAGIWKNDVAVRFWHESGGSREEIRVKSGDAGHTLQLTFDAFAETWTGDARGGTSSGPDAEVAISLSHRIENVS